MGDEQPLIDASDVVVKILPQCKRHREFILERDFHIRYCCRDSTKSFLVPKGFRTNFASSPRVLWSILSPLDICFASLVHDYLYSRNGQKTYGLSRKEADEVMRSIIERTHSRLLASACYYAVRAAGSAYFLKA